MTGAQYTKPTSQVDLEARQADDYVPPATLAPLTDPQLSDNGYIGVDPIYFGAASSTDLPIKVTEGPEAAIQNSFIAEDAVYLTADDEEAESDGDDDAEEEDNSSSSSSTPVVSDPS